MVEKASPGEMQQGMAEYNAFTESIKKNGNYVGGEALQPTKTRSPCASGRQDFDDRWTYVETKEQLGGYYLIKAKDLNDAVQGRRGSRAKHGIVEVRPIMEFDQP